MENNILSTYNILGFGNGFAERIDENYFLSYNMYIQHNYMPN